MSACLETSWYTMKAKLPELECHEQDVTKRECKIIDKEMV